MKFNTIYPRDIIALITLIGCYLLIRAGYDGIIQGVAILIIGYYFSKRVYEENNTKKK